MHAAWLTESKISSEGPSARSRLNRFHKSDPQPWDENGQLDGDDAPDGYEMRLSGLHTRFPCIEVACREEEGFRPIKGALFNPHFVEIDRIVAMRLSPAARRPMLCFRPDLFECADFYLAHAVYVTSPSRLAQSVGACSSSEAMESVELLVKWRSLGYAACTWESRADIAADKLAAFLRWNMPADVVSDRPRPASEAFSAMLESPSYAFLLLFDASTETPVQVQEQ